VVDLLTTAKKYADADDAKKLLNEGTGKAPYSPRRDGYHDNRSRDDFRGRSDIRDYRNDNRDRRDNRNQHRDRRDNFKGKHARDDDGEVNTVKKFGGHCNYEEDYAKALKGPCLAHPKSNHTLENCKVLKEIYRHKQASENADKSNDATDQRNHMDDDEDDLDKNPKNQYQEPMRHVATIIGGKVSVESKHERKLLARACLSVAKTDDLIADPRLPPGHTEKSTSAGWINGPPSPNQVISLSSSVPISIKCNLTGCSLTAVVLSTSYSRIACQH
jgi:hypothetical protein